MGLVDSQGHSAGETYDTISLQNPRLHSFIVPPLCSFDSFPNLQEESTLPLPKRWEHEGPCTHASPGKPGIESIKNCPFQGKDIKTCSLIPEGWELDVTNNWVICVI